MIGADEHVREPRDSRPGMRRAVATVVVAAATIWLSNVLAFGFMYSTPPGAQRLRDMTPGLVASAGLGVLGVAVGLALLKRRLLSPWLTLGVVPAVLATLDHAGVVG